MLSRQSLLRAPWQIGEYWRTKAGQHLLCDRCEICEYRAATIIVTKMVIKNAFVNCNLQAINLFAAILIEYYLSRMWCGLGWSIKRYPSIRLAAR
jgi:hypothetical protein